MGLIEGGLGGPLAAVLDLAGSAALQAVSECYHAARLVFSIFCQLKIIFTFEIWRW